MPTDITEKELELLREAVDLKETAAGRAQAHAPEVERIISILEQFLRRKKLICYGGTAINNILPSTAQFYDRDVEIPDYDFYSTNPLDDAKELADIYVAKGYTDVEAKSGVHHGTYKVYVNFLPVADITEMVLPIFQVLKKEAIKVDGILYAPPNFLRMNMYLELSRPDGDVSRWEKVFKRLTLLNTHFPFNAKGCANMSFMRGFVGDQSRVPLLYKTVRKTLTDLGLVFVGGYASSLYGKYMPKKRRKQFDNIPDFDVLSTDPATSAEQVATSLRQAGFDNVTVDALPAVGEIVPQHYCVNVGENTVCLILEPNGCQSFNTIHLGGETVRVASIDTLLNLYLTFTYADRPYFQRQRLLCMAAYLFEVQMHNRLAQKGLLQRFPLTCYGSQPTLKDLREEKSDMYEKLKHDRTSREYESWFLRYTPKKGTRKVFKSLPPTSVKKTKAKRTTKRVPKSKK